MLVKRVRPDVIWTTVVIVHRYITRISHYDGRTQCANTTYALPCGAVDVVVRGG